MNDQITSDGIQQIRQRLPGPITLRVSFPEEFHRQNQVLQKTNKPKLFLQLRDKQNKAIAYLYDDAFQKLHRKIIEGDTVDIYRYDVEEVKEGKKVIKIMSAELVRNNDDDDNKSDNSDLFDFHDKKLVPGQQERNQNRSNQNTAEKRRTYMNTYHNNVNSGNLTNQSSRPNNNAQANNDENKTSPFEKVTGNRRNTDPIARSLFNQGQNNNSGHSSKGTSLNKEPVQNASTYSNDDNVYVPISELSILEKNWLIKVRICQKGDKVTFKRRDRENSENCLFNIFMMDREGSEISATFFDNISYEKYYDKFIVGKVYALSGGVLKENQKKYGKSQNDLQIVFDSRSHIWFSELDNDPRIPRGQYNLVKIQDIYSRDIESTIDVVGVIVKIGEIESLTTNDGRAVPIRKFEIMDDALKPIELTLWDYKAAIKLELHAMIMITPVRIKKYGGAKTLSIPNNAEIILGDIPELPIVRQLKEWFGKSDQKEIKNTMNIIVLDEQSRNICDLESDVVNETQTYWVKAYLIYVYDDRKAFAACPYCKKQVDFNKNEFIKNTQSPIKAIQSQHVSVDGLGSDLQDGVCGKCSMTFSSPIKQSLIRAQISDMTGTLSVTAFGLVAEKLLGVSTDELFASQFTENKLTFSDKMNQEYKFQLKYAGDYQNHRKFVIQKVLNLDFPGESQDILSRLELYRTIVPIGASNLYDLF